MRITITLDDDVAAALERRRREHNQSLKQVVNELLRIGLQHTDEPRGFARMPA
jgi:Ribbon-helix-helix protein, copG family